MVLVRHQKGLILPRRRLMVSALAAPVILRARGQPFPGMLMKAAGGAPASVLIAHGAAANNGTAFSAIDTTGANTLFFAISSLNGSTPAPADSKSNTWTLLVSDLTASPDLRLYYCAGATVGSGHTFSVTGSSTFYGFAVAAFSGLTGTPADGSNHAHSASSTTLQPGAVTPSTSKSLAITAYGYATAATFTINGSFLITDQKTFVPGNSFGIGLAWETQAGTAAINPTWTNSNGGSAATAALGAFKST